MRPRKGYVVALSALETTETKDALGPAYREISNAMRGDARVTHNGCDTQRDASARCHDQCLYTNGLLVACVITSLQLRVTKLRLFFSKFRRFLSLVFVHSFLNKSHWRLVSKHHHDYVISSDIYRALLRYQGPRFARGPAEVQFPIYVVSTPKVSF